MDGMKFNKIQKKYLRDTPAGKLLREQEDPGSGKKYNAVQRKYLGSAGWTFDPSGAVKTAPVPGKITPRQIGAPAPSLPAKAPKDPGAALRPKTPKMGSAPLFGGAGKESARKAPAGISLPEKGGGKITPLPFRDSTGKAEIGARPLPGFLTGTETAPGQNGLWDGKRKPAAQEPALFGKGDNTPGPVWQMPMPERKPESGKSFAMPTAESTHRESGALRAERLRREDRVPARERPRPLRAGGRLQHEDMPLDEFMGVTPYAGDKPADPSNDTVVPSGGIRTDNRENGDSIRYFDNSGQRIWADMSSLQGIGVLPDGTYINTTGDSDADVLYEILRAEAAGEISAEEANRKKAQLARQIAADKYPSDMKEQEALYRDRLTAFLNRDISYYTEIPDVTERLREIMRTAEKEMNDYTYYLGMMADATDDSSVMYFRRMVTDHGPYDIKYWPEFLSHSLFVFDGEIVSRDALGNILYGYLGKTQNFSDLSLRAFAGLNQMRKASLGEIISSFRSFGDDERDQERILQGIRIYNEIQGHLESR